MVIARVYPTQQLLLRMNSSLEGHFWPYVLPTQYHQGDSLTAICLPGPFINCIAYREVGIHVSLFALFFAVLVTVCAAGNAFLAAVLSLCAVFF